MADLKEKTFGYVVEFDKLLNKGTLNGLTIKDRVHFATEKDALSWVRDVQSFDKDNVFTHFKIKGAA
jgi:hypothetical protein